MRPEREWRGFHSRDLNARKKVRGIRQTEKRVRRGNIPGQCVLRQSLRGRPELSKEAGLTLLILQARRLAKS